MLLDIRFVGLKNCGFRHQVIAEQPSLLARRLHGKAPQQGEERCSILPAFTGASAEHALDHATLEPGRPALRAPPGRPDMPCRAGRPRGKAREILKCFCRGCKPSRGRSICRTILPALPRTGPHCQTTAPAKASPR